ncbi:OLC1v1019151C1 [Oldenlandia corymbosa var. corymbosa]|uniref:OLC1v1019151C1 n=1 Tax=Oldenlandia corymbosa var. corymbosa TaxID=529605 RepID=A0AAV1EDF4_OLDCO|nr:OLC1v1019151C1 [Oldenlandia corymbosa var. corymbosa]
MESGSDPPNRNKINEGLPSSSSPPPAHEPDLSLMPDYPDEIAIEILSRLPAKPLGKFKCVSRPWLSLISSPEFIKTHLAVASRRNNYAHHRLMLSIATPSDDDNGSEDSSDGDGASAGDRDPEYLLYTLDSILNPASDETEATPAEVFGIDYLIQSNKSYYPLGSCNGLICVRTLFDELFLCNPCTKKHKKLPHLGTKWGYMGAEFGFGYDALNDDYKVIGVSHYVNEIIVYSLKTDSCRRIEDFKAVLDGEFSRLHYVNGKFYWPTLDVTDDWKIASFDLGNETYGIMDFPPENKEVQYSYGLGEMGGCLSVIYDYRNTHADVWVWKESWIKVVFIPYIDALPASYYITQSVWESRDGEILCILRSALFLIDLKAKTSCSYTQIGLIETAFMHVESLVSP